MPRIAFTPHIARHVACPPEAIDGPTLGHVLATYFTRHPLVRGYVLDDQGAVRKHVVVFIGGTQARDRDRLTDPVRDDDEIFVMQALSGG